MTEQASPTPTEPNPPIDSELFLGDKKKSSKKGLLLTVVVVALAVALVSGGIMVYRKAMGGNDKATPAGENILPETEVTPAAEATPVPDLDRTELKIQILNGSGTPGFAGKAKDHLLSLGYENIETGNAGSYDYEETEIAIKESMEGYLDMLKVDLVEKYVVASKTTTLDEDEEYDVIITLGSDEAKTTAEDEDEEEAAPTPTTAEEETETPVPTPEG